MHPDRKPIPHVARSGSPQGVGGHRRWLLAVTCIVALLLACQAGPCRAPAVEPTRTVASPTVLPPLVTPTPSPTLPGTPTRVERATPTRRPSPTPTPSPTARPTATFTPMPKLPDAGPLPAVWTELYFGLAAGNVRYPSDLAFDREAGVAYVLGGCGADTLYEEVGAYPCVSSFDVESDRALHTSPVPGSFYGKLVLAGGTLYVHHPWVGDLYAVDRERLAATETFSGVLAIASDEEDTTYAVTEEGIARLWPDSLTRPIEPPERSFGNSPVSMIATVDQVYLLGYQTLRIWSSELVPIATIDVKELGPYTMVLDGERGTLYIGGTAGLYAFDVETQRLGQVLAHTEDGNEVRNIQELVLDATGERLFALAYPYVDWFGRMDVVVIHLGGPRRTDRGLAAETLFSALDGRLLGLAYDRERERLLVASSEDHALIPIALAASKTDTGARIGPRLPVGIQISEVIVDEGSARLYVSDSAGWVHVLDRRTYARLGQAYGGRAISLDAAHGWLYAGDPRIPVVTQFAISPAGKEPLAVERTIPQAGVPRANPIAEQVVIINRRFYVYDGASGERSDDLLPGIGQPSPECLGCYYTIGREVVVDVRRGLTATITYTPWPGKAGPRESIDYDPGTGETYHALLTGGYVHYSSIARYPDLSRLQQRGQPTHYLEGLSGPIKLDPLARRLYVTWRNTLYVLDSETLNRIGRVYTEGWQPVIAAIDGDLGRLYSPRRDGLVVWTRTGGAPPSPPLADPPIAREAITGVVQSILPSPAFARDRTLLATIDQQLFRSVDGGDTWQRLRGGLPEFAPFPAAIHAVFSPDYAQDRMIFAGIHLHDTLGEGVYRSTDGGDTWAPASDGLHDLRVYRIVPSPRFARDRQLLAYARIPEGEAVYRSRDAGDGWQLVLRQTRHGTPSLPRPEEILDLYEHLPRFQCDYHGACQRSGDGGETWVGLDTASARLDSLVEYVLSPHYAEDRTVYMLTQSDLYRYQESEQAWSVCTSPFFGDRDYSRSLTSLAAAATGDARHVLFVGSVDDELERFAAVDLPWARLRPPPTPPAPTPSPTPCAEAIDDRFDVDLTGSLFVLGCATEPAQAPPAVVQSFELGTMVWRADTRQIIVLEQHGTWSAYEDTWQEGQPDRDPQLVPPEGFYQPVRGFGVVWREQLGGSKAGIGWATVKEHAFATVIQRFTNGLLLRDENGTVLALHDRGIWELLGE